MGFPGLFTFGCKVLCVLMFWFFFFLCWAYNTLIIRKGINKKIFKDKFGKGSPKGQWWKITLMVWDVRSSQLPLFLLRKTNEEAARDNNWFDIGFEIKKYDRKGIWGYTRHAYRNEVAEAQKDVKEVLFNKTSRALTVLCGVVKSRNGDCSSSW